MNRFHSEEINSADKLQLKRKLIEKLFEVSAFWSYSNLSEEQVPDEELIEKVFVHLDMPEIALLFKIYSREYIRKVWRNQLAIQGDYLFNLNVMIALYYFNIRKPEEYLHRIEREHIKKLLNHA